MQIKAADDNAIVLEALAQQLARRDVSAAARQRIEQEIRNVRAGRRAERDAAHEIESYCHDSANVMTIHDLRLEHGGFSAQIDHLVINRYLGFWVCESKSFSEGVEINDHGDWSAIYEGIPRGIRSPVQQNKKHINLLKTIFGERIVRLPRRFGFTINPIYTGMVLISNRARILRPSNPSAAVTEDLATVVKAEQLTDTMNRQIDARLTLGAFATTIVRLVSQATVEHIARDLASLHAPSHRDFAGKFAASQAHAPAMCANCRIAVSDGIVNYCRDYPALFKGSVYCFPCQQLVKSGRLAGSR